MNGFSGAAAPLAVIRVAFFRNVKIKQDRSGDSIGRERRLIAVSGRIEHDWRRAVQGQFATVATVFAMIAGRQDETATIG